MEHLLGRSKVEPRVKLVDHWAVTAVGEVMCAAKAWLGRGVGEGRGGLKTKNVLRKLTFKHRCFTVHTRCGRKKQAGCTMRAESAATG